MNLRRFNQRGVEDFQRYLDIWTPQMPPAERDRLLSDPSLSDEVVPTAPIQQKVFSSRLDAAKYLDGVFQAAAMADVEQDRGLWCWLSLFYFDQMLSRPRGGD